MSGSAADNSAYLDDCAKRKLVFVTGKGGVGKSSVVWATALALRRRGLRVRVAAWVPFADTETPALASDAGISFTRLDTLECFREYALRIVKFSAVYNAVFENRVLQSFLLAAPGLAETVVAGKLWDLVDKNEQDVLLVDLPASGHALSFFRSPIGILKVFPTGFVHRESQKVVALFGEERSRLDIVTLPEELPMRESEELYRELGKLHPFRFGYLIVNQTIPAGLHSPSSNEAFDPATKVALERFAMRRRSEEEALAAAKNLPLQTVALPFVAPDSGVAIVERLSRHLEPEGA